MIHTLLRFGPFKAYAGSDKPDEYIGAFYIRLPFDWSLDFDLTVKRSVFTGYAVSLETSLAQGRI